MKWQNRERDFGDGQCREEGEAIVFIISQEVSASASASVSAKSSKFSGVEVMEFMGSSSRSKMAETEKEQIELEQAMVFT